MNFLLESKLEDIKDSLINESANPLNYLEEYLAARRGITVEESRILFEMIEQDEADKIQAIKETYKFAMAKLTESYQEVNDVLIQEGEKAEKAKAIAALLAGKTKAGFKDAAGKELAGRGYAAGKAGAERGYAAGKAGAERGYAKGKEIAGKGVAKFNELDRKSEKLADKAVSGELAGQIAYHRGKGKAKGVAKSLARDVRHWAKKGIESAKKTSKKQKLATAAAAIGLTGAVGGLKAYAKHRARKKAEDKD